MAESTGKMPMEVRRRARAVERISEIRTRIAALDFVCSGTLTHRTNRCGKANCRCQTDPAARHGPYYDWTRLERGKLAHRLLSPEQADLVGTAIANFREVRALLRRWEDETLRAAGVRPTRKR